MSAQGLWRKLSFTTKIAVISALGGLALALILILSFCGSVSEASDSLKEQSSDTAKSFTLLVNGQEYDIASYNEKDDKEESGEFTVTAKSKRRLSEIFIAFSPIDEETTFSILLAEIEVEARTLDSGVTSLTVALDDLIDTGQSVDIKATATVRLQTILVRSTQEA